MTFVVTVYKVFGEPNTSSHEVSGGFISPKPTIAKEVGCMNLQFHLETFELVMILSFTLTE